MSRYINADRLIKHFSWWDADEKARDWKEIFEEVINAQPTADVVEIVRCKDCKMRIGNECKLLKERDPESDNRIWGGFFCAYGERREDGEIH